MLLILCSTAAPTYVAPEILKNCPYDQSADMWSIGVILFVLLCGYPPFADENQSVLFQKIRVGDWRLDPEDASRLSQPAQEMLKKLLRVNPMKRWTARQCLESKWMLMPDTVEEEQVQDSTGVRRRKSQLRGEMEKAAKAVQATISIEQQRHVPGSRSGSKKKVWDPNDTGNKSLHDLDDKTTGGDVADKKRFGSFKNKQQISSSNNCVNSDSVDSGGPRGKRKTTDEAVPSPEKDQQELEMERLEI